MVNKETKIISSAQKCLQILKYMAYSNEELSINQIAEAMALNKSSAHHYLSTLVLEGFLAQNPQTKKYRIGLEAFKVGECYLRKDFPYPEIGEVLRQLYEIVNESTYFFIRTELKVVCILAKEGAARDKVHLEIGTALPMHASASGKVFLAYTNKAKIERIFRQGGLEAFTDKTITDLDLLEEEIMEVRLRGYAFSDREYGEFRELSVPAIGFGDKIVGALSIIGYADRLSDRDIKEMIKHITHFGRIISDVVHNVVLS